MHQITFDGWAPPRPAGPSPLGELTYYRPYRLYRWIKESRLLRKECGKEWRIGRKGKGGPSFMDPIDTPMTSTSLYLAKLMYTVQALGLVSPVPKAPFRPRASTRVNARGLNGAYKTEKELNHLSVMLRTLWTVRVLSTQKLLQNVWYLQQAAFHQQYQSHVIRIISSTNYFRQSPQLQKTTILEHANTIGWPTTHYSRLFDSNFIYRAFYSDIY